MLSDFLVLSGKFKSIEDKDILAITALMEDINPFALQETSKSRFNGSLSYTPS